MPSTASLQAPRVDLNLRVRGMSPSATVAINERCNELQRRGRRVFKLGLGQSPFPVPDSVVQSLRDHAAEKDYLPVSGLRPLRDAVAEFHHRRDGVARSGDDVLIGPGSKELMFLLQLVYYGDLIIPTPAWVSYAPHARIIGRQVHLLPTDARDGWLLRPEKLDALCRADPGRPRILILNYPSNPTGGTFLLDEIRSIAEIAREHRIVLLSDEIYGELQYDGQHISIARYYPEGTIVSSGLSKWCGAGGWRLGTFVFPPQMNWLLQAMAAAASETYTSTSAPIQYAAVRAFTGGPDIEAYLDDSRRVLAALGEHVTTSLAHAGVHCLAPRGAFYVFPSFAPFRERLAARGIRSSTQLCERLLRDTGVAVLPGSEFGRLDDELTCRIAFVDFDGAAALSAVAELEPDAAPGPDFLRDHCARVCTAIERLTEWLTRD